MTQPDGVTPCQRIGILYSPWHWPAYTAQQMIKARGGTPLNMEMILSSRLELGVLAFGTSSSPGEQSVMAAACDVALHAGCLGCFGGRADSGLSSSCITITPTRISCCT